MRLSPLAQALSLSTIALLLTACNDDINSDTTSVVRDVTLPLLITSSNFNDVITAVAASFISGEVKDTGGVKSLTYQINDRSAQPLTLDASGKFDDTVGLELGRVINNCIL